MAKALKVLLTETVDNLGIVGDVVSVRLGYARNYLFPHNYAAIPSDELVEQLKEKRAEAERVRAMQRKEREGTIERLRGYELTIERSCNDQGILYGSVTQQDIARALTDAGHPVKARDVRIPFGIKRIDHYDITIKPEADLEAVIKLWVVADRKLEEEDEEKPEMEFDDEGNLIEPRKSEKGKGRKKGAEAAEPAEGAQAEANA